MLRILFTPFFLLLATQLATAQSTTPGGYESSPYSAEVEEPLLDATVIGPVPARVRQDTSAGAVAWVQPFQSGFRALRRDGKMGLLNPDLSIRIPFIYVDIQWVATGINERDDFALVARRSSHGRYGIIGEDGVPNSEFALSYNSRLLVSQQFILDSPHPGRYYIRHRDGTPAYAEAFSAVWTHPILNAEGHAVLNVRQANQGKLALFHVDKEEVVTPFQYDRISRVEPIVGKGNYVPLLEGYTKVGIDLLRPCGKLLSPLKFAGVEGYNNWKQLRIYFGLPDDPTAEAIAWTKNMEVYVVYADDRVVHLGRYENI